MNDNKTLDYEMMPRNPDEINIICCPHEWISVNNRLPEPINETVLFTDGDGVFPGFFSSNHEYMLNAEETCEECNFYVTHWMPLPEPPK